MLDVDRGAHGFDRALKFGQDCITCRIEDATVMGFDTCFENADGCNQLPKRLLLVLRDESAVFGRVGGQDCCNLALHALPICNGSRPRVLNVNRLEQADDMTSYARPDSKSGRIATITL